MSDLKEFKIVLEESDTGRQLVLPNVMASDYDVAEAYGNHVAADLPVSEIDRQQGFGLSETSWSCYPEEVKPEPEKMRRMEWNTGRHYGSEGQIIRAVEYKEVVDETLTLCGVFLLDMTRKLCYQIEDCPFTHSGILHRYDLGGNFSYSTAEFEKAWAEAVDV